MVIRTIAFSALIFSLSACGVNIPRYDGSFDNVEELKNVSSDGIKTDKFSASQQGIDRISVRGNPLRSPHGKNLVDYIKYAIEFDLEKAGLLNESANKSIDLLVLENDINAGSDTGTGRLNVEFTIKENDTTELYKQSFSVDKTWESSFLGAIAIPAAANNYPTMVKSLLKQLYSDNNFKAALSK